MCHRVVFWDRVLICSLAWPGTCDFPPSGMYRYIQLVEIISENQMPKCEAIALYFSGTKKIFPEKGTRVDYNSFFYSAPGPSNRVYHDASQQYTNLPKRLL